MCIRDRADYALKLCSHLDRILEMGNLRALWTACQSIEESCPELQPDITETGDAENFDGLVACPPAALQRPRPEKQLVGLKPLKGSVVVKHKTKLEQSKIDDMAKRLSAPKRSTQDKSIKETDVTEQRKGQFMLQEEYDNCTFRPTTKYRMDVLTKSAIKKPAGNFYPTNAFPQRKPGPHGKARYEGDTNCDPSGEEQERSCICFVASSLQPSIWAQSETPDPNRISKDSLERLIRLALDDEQQVQAWGLTAGEVVLLRQLRGKQQLFQLTDDLRAKAFLERITNQLSNRSTKEARQKEQKQLEQQAAKVGLSCCAALSCAVGCALCCLCAALSCAACAIYRASDVLCCVCAAALSYAACVPLPLIFELGSAGTGYKSQEHKTDLVQATREWDRNPRPLQAPSPAGLLDASSEHPTHLHRGVCRTCGTAARVPRGRRWSHTGGCIGGPSGGDEDA
eukprot:TRINITY_DN3968_c0_g1_i1.p1 TRINITY_DN3968_c0_g1~~TRINITY_DN3968_c0_g1_i1.p1  ORF type:complete len:455 (-),score=103.64 TRINITY_DN3968_c0_g1_i1:218-1582(-)